MTTIITRRRFAALAAAVPFAGIALRASAHDGHDHGSSSATPSASPAASPAASLNTGTGGAYVTITNNGSSDDRLIGGSTDVAQLVQVHEMLMDGGVMKMQEVEGGLVIPAGETVSLDPTNYHIMLIGLNESLLPDTTYELTLTFEVAGDLTIPVSVQLDAPEDPQSAELGDLVLSGAWSRPAAYTPAGDADASSEHGDHMDMDATPES